MIVRRERPGDAAAVRRVHTLAFGRDGGINPPVEVTLADDLRTTGAWLPRLTLVTELGGEVVGSVIASRATVTADRPRPVVALGPIGVLPAHQRHGVGSALVHGLLTAADALDEPLVALLGSPAYYGRFGFRPGTDVGVQPPVTAWGEHFQVRPLSAYRPEVAGVFGYAEPFARV